MDNGFFSLDDCPAALRPLYEPILAATERDHGHVVAQLGQSLDGCVATASGDSFYVTGPESLVHLHRLRAVCDVVLVGAGTVAADNPRLTTREVRGPHPVRAVLDPWARLDGSAGVFNDGLSDTLWICDAVHAAAATARLRSVSASGSASAAPEVVGIEGLLGASGFDPSRVIASLAVRGLKRIFVEGGGVTVSRFLSAGCLDRLHLIVAPVFIGTGKPGLSLPPWATMKDCPRPPASVHRLGDDMLWDLDLKAAIPAISRFEVANGVSTELVDEATKP